MKSQVKEAAVKVLDAVEDVLEHISEKHGQHAQSSHGRGGGEGGSSSGGGGTPGAMSYGGLDSKEGGVKISPNGQIKLKRPKSVAAASAQVKAMTKIMDKALADSKAAESLPANSKEKVFANLRANHVSQQLSRAMGNAGGFVGKSAVDELKALLVSIEKKYKIKAVDPSGPDPILDLKE